VVPPLDYASIADMLGRSIGSIGPSRDRALKKLRKLLPTGLVDTATGQPTEPTAPDAPNDAQPPVEETER